MQVEEVSNNQDIHPGRRCRECEQLAIVRCPDCGQGYCVAHGAIDTHSPCMERELRRRDREVCYACATLVHPSEWSVSATTHYKDSHRCAGCYRYVCDDLHTRLKTDRIRLNREGMRGHLYHTTTRFCNLCAPFAAIGGIFGLVCWLGTITLLAFLLYHFAHLL